MKETLKQKVRGVIVARNTIERMGNSIHYRNPVGKMYLNTLATDVMNLAKRTHKLMPYYLATRKV